MVVRVTWMRYAIRGYCLESLQDKVSSDGGIHREHSNHFDLLFQIHSPVAELLKPENKDKLTAILTYHVVPGKVLAADVVGLKSAKTVNGKEVAVAVQGSSVMIDKANVVATDIETSNGVVHMIDNVLLP